MKMLTATVGLVFKVEDNDPEGIDAEIVIDTVERALTAFKDQVRADSAYLEDLFAIEDGTQFNINKE